MNTPLTLISLLYFSVASLAQITPGQLMTKELQDSIIKKTSEFDSLVFVNFAGYWSDRQEIRGFGYIKNIIYKVQISFIRQEGDEKEAVYKINKKKIRDRIKADSIRNLNFRSMLALNIDSLDVKGRGGTYTMIDDASFWTIIGVYPIEKILMIRQVYALGFYQFTSEQIALKKGW